MFGKNKNKLDTKSTFIFGLVSGIAIFAVIISLFLVIKSGNKGSFVGDKVVKENVKSKTNSAQAPTPGRPPATPATFAGKVTENKNAKITVEVFDDFECPFCLRHTNTLSQMFDEYGDQINFVLKHFPLSSIHLSAQKAAEAYECANEQGKPWEMHDKLFESQAARNMSVATWKKDAVSLGLDTDKFDNCLDSGKYEDKVKQDQAEGRQKGVRVTPTTFVNGEVITGAVPYSTLKAVIEKNL